MNADGAASPFVATRWTMVLRARGESVEAKAALSELCAIYYEPVVRFLQREGRTPEAARELAQDFFERILSGSGFAGADPERGRFRSYLLGALKHFLADARMKEQRLKRGGGVVPESLDATEEDTGGGWQVPDQRVGPDLQFDREWALAVMDRALSLLQKEMTANQKGAHFAALKPWLMGDAGESSQAEVARQLGMNEGALKVAVYRLRKRFRDVVRGEVAQTLREPSLVDEELAHLISALS